MTEECFIHSSVNIATSDICPVTGDTLHLFYVALNLAADVMLIHCKLYFDWAGDIFWFVVILK